MMIINGNTKVFKWINGKGWGYYLPLNKNNKGVSELVGTFTHHEKTGEIEA